MPFYLEHYLQPWTAFKHPDRPAQLPELTRVFIFSLLTLKAPNKNCSRRHFNFFTFIFPRTKCLTFHVNPVRQRIHMKYPDLFSLRKNFKKSAAGATGPLRVKIPHDF